MKIVVLDGFTLNPGDLSWDQLKELGDLRVFDRTPYDKDSILNAAEGADILLTNKTPLTKEIIQLLPDLKYIGVLATGYNVVDTKAAAEQKIVVTNVPAYSTVAVAQMTFALLLELSSKVAEHCIAVKSGEWVRSADFSFTTSPLLELHGKVMGIVGFGQIGRAVARIAQAFGMQVRVYNRTRYPEFESDSLRFVTMDALFHESDIISLHTPLTSETEGMINRENIRKMKDGVLLINTARGGLVVENDLTEALNSGKIGGAGLDVISVEPMRSDNPLLHAANCVITPHIAWATREARERLMQTAVNNVKAFLNGQPVNVVS